MALWSILWGRLCQFSVWNLKLVSNNMEQKYFFLGATWCSTVRVIFTSSRLTRPCVHLLLRAVSRFVFLFSMQIFDTQCPVELQIWGFHCGVVFLPFYSPNVTSFIARMLEMSVWRKMHFIFYILQLWHLSWISVNISRFNFPPTRAKSVFLALERRRRRRDKSNQLNRLLPRGEAGYESDSSLFTGFAASPLDIYCNWVSYIVLQKMSSVQVKDSFYFSLIHTEPDGLPLGGLQQVWRSKQLIS